MVTSSEESLVFKLTWFDEMAASDRPYKIFFYPVDNSIEIIDVKSGKVHLRRIRNFDVERNSLFVGNQITIYGRKYKIVEFGDQ
jgi:nucleoside-diphosphate kinase